MATNSKNMASMAAANLAVIMRQMLTGKDNVSANIIKVLAFLSVIVALGLTIFDVVKHGKPFDIQSYGIGMGSLFGLVGAALGLSAHTEPEADIQTTTKGVTSIIQTGSTVQSQTFNQTDTQQVTPNVPDIQPIVQPPMANVVDVVSTPVETLTPAKPKTPFPLFKPKAPK